MKRILCAILLISALVCMLAGCGLTVPRPEIKEGEFAFSVTYELGGETKTVSGVYVCKYRGTDWALDGVSHRDWDGYIKDGTVSETIRLAVAEDGGIVELNLVFEPGRFMGDPYREGEEPFEPWITVRIEDAEGLSFENDADLIAAVYGARIIGYEYDRPIENSFGLFK